MISDGSVFPGYEGLDADAARAQFAEGRIGMILQLVLILMSI